MAENLNDVEARIVGCLIEKQLTTPEYYPLTLNALTAACNQKSNRDPVVLYDETTILTAIDSLRDKNLVYLFYGSSSRAVKYKHMLPSVYELEPPAVAVIAVLLLRGPQTIGELRERTGRLHEFSSLGEVSETLDTLVNREPPLIAKLDRQPGQKEARFAHLLSGDVKMEDLSPAREKPAALAKDPDERIGKLEREIESLRSELTAFRETFDEFRKQFD
jgi:uncharacterized protein